MLRGVWLVILMLGITGTALAGCSSPSSTAGEHDLKMAPMSMMPDAVKSAALLTRQAYQFAVANPDVTEHIPCYCGCGAMGHTSNYMCYVKSVAADGTVNFDSHAIGCSICVDITQDVMRLSRQGKSVGEIKAYIDQTYSRFGPSNMP
jgi:hypothetical protein